jgi:alpha-tubulin suppressor-like RCC1 family protein
MSDGTVKQWGAFGGTLTNGVATIDQSPVPVAVPGLSDAVQVAGGATFACVRHRNGAVSCWGFNNLGVLGKPFKVLGSSKTPVQVIARGATDVAAGYDHACAVVDKKVWCWGGNGSGQLGNNSTTGSETPVMAAAEAHLYTRLFAGPSVTCALEEGGWLECWGSNQFGQLGGPEPTMAVAPRVVPNTAATVDAAVGQEHVCNVKANGSVWCWSKTNGWGEAGNGTFKPQPTATAIEGLTDATQVAAAFGLTCVRRQSGAAACWGDGRRGAIGDGAGEGRATPTMVPGLSRVRSIATHLGGHLCALLETGDVKCWGYNNQGQIGDGSTMNRFTPVAVQLP